MPILCLGLNHTTAPVELREQLIYTSPDLRAALARFLCERDENALPISELAILSTCNRLEFYAVCSEGDQDPEAAPAVIRRFLAETRGIPIERFAPNLYQYHDLEAVRHLCRVAAGLDSMILGETQIFGQVVEAHEIARTQEAAGPALAALFRVAVRAGKRARNETAISHNAATVSSIAARLAAGTLGDVQHSRALVLGTGEMSELTVESLRARGLHEITVISRAYHRAEEVARRWNGQSATYDGLLEALVRADLVITSTSAPHLVISSEIVFQALQQRSERPLIFIDIAVPRNVDPEVQRLPNVRYYDIDDLHNRLDGSLAERVGAIPRVEAIIEEEVSGFMHWQQSLAFLPIIRSLRLRAEAVRQAELDKALRRLPGLSGSDRARVEAMTRALVNKLLHQPTLRLKTGAENGHRGEDYVAAVRHLFALDE